MRSELRCLFITTVLAGLALAGCGSTGPAAAGGAIGRGAMGRDGSYPEAAKSAGQIYADVQAAARTVRSVRITGSMAQGGDTARLAFVVGTAGAYGTLTVDGVAARLMRVGSAGYVKAPEASWQNALGEEEAQLLKGKWVMIPVTDLNSTDSGSYGILRFLTIRNLLGQLFTVGDSLAKVPGIHVIGGIPTVELRDTTDGTQLYVAVAGITRPIEELGGQGFTGSLRFTGYGQPVKLARPAGAVSLSSLSDTG
jgi:hypothetical protein